MATATQEDLNAAIKKIEQRSRDRQKVQGDLEFVDTLSPSDRGRLENELRRCNAEIAELAERVNSAFQSAARDQQAIDPIRVSDSIADPRIQQWLLGVKDSIDKHNKSLQGDSPKLTLHKRELERKIGDAKRMREQTERVTRELQTEAEKIRRRVEETDRLIQERESHAGTLKKRVEQARRDEDKLKQQLRKLEDARGHKKREREALERQRQQADATRQRETKPDIKRRERAKVEEAAAKIEQIDVYIRDQIDRRVQEYQKVEQQLRDEQRSFADSLANCEADRDQLQNERTLLEKRYKECGERLQDERNRLDEISRTQSRLEDAFAQQPY